MKLKYLIGYIDENAEQVKLYHRKLKKYGFKVIGYKFKKGMTLEQLMDQVYKTDIDLLMIDFKLNETNIVSFNGEAVESKIYDEKPLFPHIIFTNKVDQAEPFVEDLKIIFSKDEIFEDGDESKVKRFVKMLEKSIEQYKNHIKKKKKQLSVLLEKEVKRELTSAEKNDLLNLQEDLMNLDRTKKREIPKQLISTEKLESLSKTRIEAEEFLQTLIDKGKKK